MKVINAAVIDKIKEFNNIEDVIGENIKLEKKGTSYTGLCPFHKEKTPSFHVNSKKLQLKKNWKWSHREILWYQ